MILLRQNLLMSFMRGKSWFLMLVEKKAVFNIGLFKSTI